MEEWSISLEDWNGAQHPTPIYSTSDLHIQICRNVALVSNNKDKSQPVGIARNRNQNAEASDLLVFNLVTRKKFYIRRAIIANEIREKTGRYINLNNSEILHTYEFYMYEKNDQVFIKFEIDESFYDLYMSQKIG